MHPDGRFLFLRTVNPEAGQQMVYIQNWRAKVESLFEEEQGL